jgi:hypothetical protein
MPMTLSRLQVYGKLELGRLLDRQIAWLSASQDLVNKRCSAPKLVRDARPISHQKPRFGLASK